MNTGLLECTPDWPGISILELPHSPTSILTASLIRAFSFECRQFFKELEGLGVTIGDFQAVEEELSVLPGKYSPTCKGGIWFAAIPSIHNGDLVDRVRNSSPEVVIEMGCLGPHIVVGCVALRDNGAGKGELKRMYVESSFRGGGVGRLLLDAAERGAKERGYRMLVLDTLRRLPSALSLYKRNGFKETGPYCHNPIEDAVFLQKEFEGVI